MQQQVSLKLTPQEATNTLIIHAYVAASLGVQQAAVTGFYIIKQSIDARSRHQIWFNVTVCAFVNEPFTGREIKQIVFPSMQKNKEPVIIVGAGPAGLFAALKLLQYGIKPIIIERGKNVRDRRRDLAILNKQGIVNPESNYCFGEGGAGTYSDGKLYTRSNKRGSIDAILNLFVQFGAEEKILYQNHPHIGTNKLPHIISAMRDCIIAYGGEVHFEHKLTGLTIKNSTITSVQTSNGNSFTGNAIILATGHSARDIFSLLHNKGIAIESKPFALGVRVEHPQQIIDACQYRLTPTLSKGEGVSRPDFLPPASYSLVQQVNGRGVFSFCMCPGGIIAPAATNPNELVVNGWSPSKRNNPFANSGMVVSVDEEAIKKFKIQISGSKALNSNPLFLMEFQKSIEEKAYAAGGGSFVAPAQRLVDFCESKISSSLPDCSYLPGINSVDLKNVLPNFIHNSLQEGFKAFGKKIKGYYTNEAVVIATESRTSSPVRIPRDAENLYHPQIKNLFPCAEGAGYAGGIVSAAMDGERVANAIAQQYYL